MHRRSWSCGGMHRNSRLLRPPHPLALFTRLEMALLLLLLLLHHCPNANALGMPSSTPAVVQRAAITRRRRVPLRRELLGPRVLP